MTITTDGARAADRRLGRALRALRHERGLTLREVAAVAGLSQPFLSQLELGRARPSMRSLYGLASALGTTQQALLARAAEPGEPVPYTGAGGDGGARLLLHADGADVTEFAAVPPAFGEYFAHGRRELLYVARGQVEVDLDGRLTVLARGGALDYDGAVPHRWRRVGGDDCVVLVVHTGA